MFISNFQFNCAVPRGMIHAKTVTRFVMWNSSDICHTGRQYEINLVYSFTARIRGIT